MTQNGYFTCKELNKKKRKRNNINSSNSIIDILDEDLARIKHCIYVCSLMTSMGDNLHTLSIEYLTQTSKKLFDLEEQIKINAANINLSM